MASVGTQIYSSDYNAVQIKVRTVLGDGYPYGAGTSNPDYGYGATLLSSPVDNTRDYSTSRVNGDVSTGSYSLTLSRITGAKIGKIVNVTGVVSNTTVTAINTATRTISISNSTTSIVSSGSQVALYYNSNILITQQQWQNLEDDVNAINKHQTNANFVGYSTISGKVSVSNLSELNTVIDNLTLTRNLVNAAQLTLDPAVASRTVPYSWGGIGNKGIQNIAYVTFNSANEMQFFFNSGGEISFGGIGPRYITAQDAAWIQLLTTVFVNTSVRFTRTEFSRIGPIPFQWYQVEDGNAPYNLNTITISAQKFNNYILFKVTFRDGHVPIGASTEDTVTDGAGYAVFQKRSTGAVIGVQPSSVTLTAFTTFSAV
jgi:hypothetical protein